MYPTLEEVKLYLRVDGDQENTLIQSLIQASASLCEGILRQPLSTEDELEEGVKMAILYGVAYLYENRDGANLVELLRFIRALLFPYREEVF